MKTGISTACLYPMETEQALALLLSLGYRRFEVFLNAFEELEKPFLRELKRRAEEYGASGNIPGALRRGSGCIIGMRKRRPTWAGNMWCSTGSARARVLFPKKPIGNGSGS